MSKKRIDTFIKNNNIPNIIFYGPYGSGKKQLLKYMLNCLYTDINDSNTITINCGDGKGIKMIRNELKFFCKSIIKKGFKTVVLLYGDKLTVDAQSALRRCIEIFSKTTRFFIILENKNKLIKPILSRFCDIYVERTSELSVKIDNNKRCETWLNNNLDKKDINSLINGITERQYNLLNVISYFEKKRNIENNLKYVYLAYIDKIRLTIFNDKLILYNIFFLFKIRPSIEDLNIDFY